MGSHKAMTPTPTIRQKTGHVFFPYPFQLKLLCIFPLCSPLAQSKRNSYLELVPLQKEDENHVVPFNANDHRQQSPFFFCFHVHTICTKHSSLSLFLCSPFSALSLSLRSWAFFSFPFLSAREYNHHNYSPSPSKPDQAKQKGKTPYCACDN